MTKFFLKGLMAVSLTVLANVAAADLYLGGGIYSSSLDVEALDEDDQALSVFLGWEVPVIPFVAVEAAYHDLGSYNAFAGGTVDAKAFSAQAVVAIPIVMFDIYAKLGVAKTDYDFPGGSDSSNDPYYAAGVAFTLLPVVDIYAEYQQFNFDEDAKIGAYGVGVKVNF